MYIYIYEYMYIYVHIPLCKEYLYTDTIYSYSIIGVCIIMPSGY